MAAVVDGDTIPLRQRGGAERPRPLGPDCRARAAPPWGEEAKAALQAMLTGEVTCEHVDADPRKDGFQEHDPYGRIVARCSVAGRDLGEAMIEAGHAKKWP